MFRLPIAESRVLRLLAESKIPLSLTDICSYNGVRPTTESNRLRRMEVKGLIIYESENRNKTRISLTNHGRRTLNAVEARK